MAIRIEFIGNHAAVARQAMDLAHRELAQRVYRRALLGTADEIPQVGKLRGRRGRFEFRQHRVGHAVDDDIEGAGVAGKSGRPDMVGGALRMRTRLQPGVETGIVQQVGQAPAQQRIGGHAQVPLRRCAGLDDPARAPVEREQEPVGLDAARNVDGFAGADVCGIEAGGGVAQRKLYLGWGRMCFDSRRSSRSLPKVLQLCSDSYSASWMARTRWTGRSGARRLLNSLPALRRSPPCANCSA
ncbi:hypothetical protein PIGHUM_04065 [Pigmentiphaga humi]|uniref:Uncharacterized protein n=1 Tax=Pigmentiphaga humi TaxID=2478468 RepID=A0A3P4B6Q6_9BURK|nr:hypothetical protein PIGHUM_04065 [Pigmentiphaga humi]